MMLLLIGVGIGLFIAGIIFWLIKDKVIGHFKNTTLTNNTKYELRENIRKN